MPGLATTQFPAVPNRRRRRASGLRAFGHAFGVYVARLGQWTLRIHVRAHSLRVMDEKQSHDSSARMSFRIDAGVSTEP